MDFDLGSRGSKLKAEQERRKVEARKKLEQERRAKEVAAAQAAEIQAQLKQKRLDQLRKEEDERRQAAELERRTAGINYLESLQPVPSKSDGDKITLPISALEALNGQDATALGPMLFELLVGPPTAQRRTHAGVLEFVAAEGTVGLPLKVMRSLGLDVEAAAECGAVSVRYIRLPKAAFVRVVPASVGLSQVSELRAMLEHNLRHHATCTEGDWLEVWHRGKQFELQVVEVRPDGAACLIDSDVELDLDLPAEAQAAVTEKAASDRSRTLRGHMTSPPPPQQQQQQLTAAAAAAAHRVSSDSDMSDDDEDTDDSAAAAAAFDHDAHRAAKSAALPPEPPSDAPLQGGDSPAAAAAAVVAVQVRLRGGKLSRRFLQSDRLRALFDFCEAAGGALPHQYRLVTAFPRRVLQEEGSDDITLAEAGLNSKQEAVILEPIV